METEQSGNDFSRNKRYIHNDLDCRRGVEEQLQYSISNKVELEHNYSKRMEKIIRSYPVQCKING